MIDSEPMLSWQSSFHPMHRLATQLCGSVGRCPIPDSGQPVFLTSAPFSQFKKFTPSLHANRAIRTTAPVASCRMRAKRFLWR